MPKIFLSYARKDLPQVEDLATQLRAEGISVWRDQESLYTGKRWPKKLGEAIAANECFLLVWSKAAAESHFVQFEWTTAAALKKPILPCLLDETPLPPALQAVQSLPLKESLQASIPDLLHALHQPYTQPTPHHRDRVIAKLDDIPETKPQEVLRQAQTIFNQKGWTVGGSVYHAGGDIHIHEGEKGKDKPKIESWVKIIGSILAILIALFTLSDKISENFFPDSSTLYLRGFVQNAEGDPIADARISVQELPDVSVTTTSDGGFSLSDIPGKAGEKVRVSVDKEGYKDHNEYVALPGPVRIRLEKSK